MISLARHGFIFLKKKSDSFEAFKNFKVMVENQSGYMIKILRSNCGGEFIGNIFKNFCEEHDIHHSVVIPKSPQQNGVVERKNRTVMEIARSMLKTKQMPKEFWG